MAIARMLPEYVASEICCFRNTLSAQITKRSPHPWILLSSCTELFIRPVMRVFGSLYQSNTSKNREIRASGLDCHLNWTNINDATFHLQDKTKVLPPIWRTWLVDLCPACETFENPRAFDLRFTLTTSRRYFSAKEQNYKRHQISWLIGRPMLPVKEWIAGAGFVVPEISMPNNMQMRTT